MAEIDFSDLIPARADAPPPAPTVDFSDLIPAKPADAPVAATGPKGDALTAGMRGLVNGVPIVGPALLGGVDRAVAVGLALENGTGYGDELKRVQQFGKDTAEEHPVASTAGEIGGGIAGTIPMVAAAPAAFGVSAAALPVRAGASLVTNGIIGGADAAVRSEGDPSATVKGGVIGAGAGLIAPLAGLAAGKVAETVASRIKPAEAVPSVEELKKAAQAAYRTADEAGVQIAQPSFGAAVSDIAQAAREAGIDRTIHPKATAALSRLEEAAGASPTLRNVDLYRRVLKGAAGSIEPDEKRIASLMIDKLDDYVGRLAPIDLVKGDAEAATKALGEARDLWGRARKAEKIETATVKAEDRAASAGSGGNTENAIRQNIRAILDSPKQRAGFTPNEVAAMRMIVRGSPVQNALRLIGKLSPAGNGLMAMLGVSATALHAPLAAVPAAGYVAKKIADRGTIQGVERLGGLIRSGGTVPVSPLALPARQAAERVIPFGFSQIPLAANRAR